MACGRTLGGTACLASALLPPHLPALRAATKPYASIRGYLCGLLHLRAKRYR